ncbi:MAG: YtxH domain-containing protein [Dehalococcoidia bacterium]
MRFIIGVLIGATVGAALGLIAAPQSGKETRDALTTRMRKNAGESLEGIEDTELVVSAA